jgi:4-hydroxy-2-oxoheptanedioate aldolase
MIETTTALESLDEILSVAGVDIVYVGPSDLSMNLGLGPGDHDGEEIFDEALSMIVDACERHGVMPGIHANAALAPRRLDQGFRMVSVAEDLGGMREAMSGALESVRNH